MGKFKSRVDYTTDPVESHKGRNRRAKEREREGKRGNGKGED